MPQLVPNSTQPFPGGSVLDCYNALVNIINDRLVNLNPASVIITGGTIDGTTIGSNVPAPGYFTTLQSNGIDVVTVSGAQSVQDKAHTLSSWTGGTISGAVVNNSTIGLTTPAAANFTTVDATLLRIGTLGYAATGLLASLQSSIAGYNQLVVRNSSADPAASANVIVNNDVSTDTTFYGEFGRNSSTFAGAGSLNLANATYLVSAGGELVLGTTTANGLRIVVNGGATDAVAISSAGVATFLNKITGNIDTANAWATARLLAGNSVTGAANVPFANQFIVRGTADTGLTGAQFLGALGTGILKNTTTTGALTIAVAGDFPTLNQNTTGSAATLTTSRNFSIAGSTGLTAAAVGFTGAANVALSLAGVLLPGFGGTGIANNAAATVTSSGNFAYTRTLTGATNVTFPTTGTLATLAGAEALSSKTITGSSLNSSPVGNSSASTGAFTTLSAASLTLGTALAVAQGGTGSTSAAAARTALSAAGMVGQIDTLSGEIDTVAVRQYIPCIYMPFACNITGITLYNGSGSCTLTLQNNGATVIAGLGASTSIVRTTGGLSNTAVAAGSYIGLNVTANTLSKALAFAVDFTRDFI